MEKLKATDQKKRTIPDSLSNPIAATAPSTSTGTSTKTSTVAPTKTSTVATRNQTATATATSNGKAPAMAVAMSVPKDSSKEVKDRIETVKKRFGEAMAKRKQARGGN